MKQYSWDEYCEKFDDWTEIARARNIFALISMGPPDEVADIILELETDMPAANRLLRKAIEMKVEFSGDNLVGLSWIHCDKNLLEEALRVSGNRLTDDDMDCLVGDFDDKVIVEVCLAHGQSIPDVLYEKPALRELVSKRKLTWEQYYAHYDEWTTETQIQNLSLLSSLGKASEVAEVLKDQDGEKPAVQKLFQWALDKKLTFSGSDLIDLYGIHPPRLCRAAVFNSINQLTEEDVEGLCDYMEAKDLRKICRERNFPVPEILQMEEIEAPVYEETKGLGFWGTLGAMFLAKGLIDRAKTGGRKGRCCGDCAKCPPHYGYRYGRWYYGHSHSYGCEFDGNDGDGRD